MEIRDIEYFAAIAEHGHLGRAAEALGLSQPALSKSLRRLEKDMRAKLVNRTAKGVALTAEGDALLSRAHPLRVSLQDIKHEIADLREGRAGLLRLGTNPGPADALLPAALGKLLSEAPGANVSVTMAGDLALASALCNGQVDFAVMTLITPQQDGIAQEPLYTDEFVITPPSIIHWRKNTASPSPTLHKSIGHSQRSMALPVNGCSVHLKTMMPGRCT